MSKRVPEIVGQTLTGITVTKYKGNPSLTPITFEKDELARNERSVRLFRLNPEDAEKLRFRDKWDVEVESVIVTKSTDKTGARIVILHAKLLQGWRTHSFFKEGRWVTQDKKIGGEETRETSVHAHREEAAYSTADGQVALVEKIWSEDMILRQRVQEIISLAEWQKQRTDLWTSHGTVPESQVAVSFKGLDLSSVVPPPLPKGVRPLVTT